MPSPSTNNTSSAMFVTLRTSCSAKGHAGASQADEPAQQRIVHQGRGRRPDADVVVAARQRLDSRAAFEQDEGDLADRPLQSDQAGADREQRSGRRVRGWRGSRCVAGAQRLRGEPGRAHAQKAESPEHEVEHQRAQRHRADVGGLGDLAHHAVSTIPSKGVETLESMIGTAIDRIAR